MIFDTQSTAFTDPRNIEVGKARVIWAEEISRLCGAPHPEGWVLPGGRRTKSRLEAHAAAVEIDRLSK